jgi:hypothetical protein
MTRATTAAQEDQDQLFAIHGTLCTAPLIKTCVYAVIIASRSTSKASLNLGLDILQSPIGSRLLASCLVGLSRSEATCLRCRVVSKTVSFANLGIRDRGGSLAIRPREDCTDNSTSQTKIVLEAVSGVLNHSVIGPAAKVPCQLGALSKPGSAWE